MSPKLTRKDIPPLLAIAIADSSSVLIRLSNTQKECIYLNDTWLSYTGNTLEEEYGFGWVKGVHKDDLQRCLHIYETAFDACQPFSMTYRLKKADGTFGVIKDDGKPYFDEHGVFQGYVGSCYDITSHVETVEALKSHKLALEDANLRLTEAIKASQVAIWDWDIVNDVLVWDDLMFSIYGIHKEATLSTVDLWKRALHPDDKAYAILSLQNAVKGIYNYDMEFRIIRPDTTVRVIKADATVIFDAQRNPIRVVGTNIDITSRKADEHKIVQLEKRNQALLDYSPVCHKIIDLDFKLRFMNLNGFNMLSLPVNDDWFGQPYPFAFFPDSAIEQMEQKLAQVKSSKQRVAFDAFTHDSKGNEVWLHHNIIPIFKNDTNELDYLTVVSADISEQKDMQLQLLHREKMDAIGQLAGGVAHDFNNQLASILGYAQLLEAEMHSDKARSYISKIISAAERSSDLTKQMLAFSRKQKLILEPVDIHSELTNTIDLLAHSTDKIITYQTTLNANKYIVTGDKSHIQSAFLNLAINAAHAMPDGGELSISSQNVDKIEESSLSLVEQAESEEYIKITFKDEGIGISEQDISKIFEPFFTTKELGKGTGMGLASVYGTVQKHAGVIGVESQLGIGTSFYVYLPISYEFAQEGVTECNNAPKQAAKSDQCILIADDEDDLRNMLENALSASGYKVLSAQNGLECVETYMAHSQNIDLIILDMSMPVMSGDEAFKKIRNINPKCKVIIASGYDSNSASIKLESVGISDVLEKPFKLEALYSTVRKVLAS
ncbi:PAS domain-containing protein [Pseudoalteromonas sp. H105]|uniref:PAS domain-containing protein n=1 Tax=Pseudoalteromonas sp. H105 TaxID=1348393 RepID=UPI0007323FDB|nr:PAS domain-containing protein [Pseudoalteromonas sp. H105]KTF16057.1 hypothetical protein ATS75_06540 [Pseudoalteromonas sp. H105]